MATCQTYVSLAEAQQLVRECVAPLNAQNVPLADAAGRTLASDIRTDLDAPPFDRAVMDGYAVRGADVAEPASLLTVIGRIPAGAMPPGALGPGTAMQINTGAPMPPGADTVIQVEATEPNSEDDQVRIATAVTTGTHVCPRGTYAVAGATVLAKGTHLTPIGIAVAAAAGADTVAVYCRPRVALLVTGDELVGAEDQPAGAQIRDSNGPAMAAALRDAGAEVVDLGRVGDDRARLRERISQGLAADCLCVTGGISMGAYDFVPELLADCGVRFVFRKMRTKPGRPTIYGVTDAGVHVFALPGNPISALVGYWMLMRPALAVLSGGAWNPPSRWAAVLAGSIRATGDREAFLPVKVRADDDGRLRADVLSWNGSGDPFGMAQANGLVVRPPHAPPVSVGDAVQVVLLDRP